MVTLIESTVSVTIRHSDSAPIASEAATVWVSRDDATGAERLSKPAPPPCDRVMAEILRCAGESPATSGDCNRHHRQYCGGAPSKSGEMTAVGTVMPAFPVIQACFRGSSLGGDTGPVVDLGAGPPVHVDESRR